MKRSELLDRIETGRCGWVDLLNSVPEDRREEPGACGEWTVKDVLVHMNYWQGYLVTLLYTLRQGATPKTVSSEAEVEANNRRWSEQGKERPWEVAWSDSEGLHRQILRRVGEFTDEEFNNDKLNPALKGKPLWQWVAQDTWEHQEEHAVNIRNWLKSARIS